MTNFQSFLGGIAWIIVSAILMLATFEPVHVEQTPDAAAGAVHAPRSTV